MRTLFPYTTLFRSHPGLTLTNLQTSGWNLGRDKPSMRTTVFGVAPKVFPFLVQQPGTGALPALYAATSPDAQGGAFYGPDGFAHLTGGPTEQKLYRTAEDRDSASRIWTEAERLAQVSFPGCGSSRVRGRERRPRSADCGGRSSKSDR